MVAQVGVDVVHDGGEEGDHPLLLFAPVDDVQQRGRVAGQHREGLYAVVPARVSTAHHVYNDSQRCPD